jgi:HPt (histidine-containing phosphotransfer) domain-containing protein
LVTVFLRQNPTLLAAMQAAIAQHDGEALQRAAHTLRGSLGTLAAPAALAAAQRLENLGRQGDMAQAEVAYANLANEIARLEHALRDTL